MNPTTHQETALLQSTDAVQFDDEQGIYRVDFDPALDTASLAVVTTIASASQTDPVDLEPLHSTINTGALDELASNSKGVIGALSAFHLTNSKLQWLHMDE